MRGAASIPFWCAAMRCPWLGPRVAPARWCGLACRPRPSRDQAAGGTGARGVQVQPHPPPPRVAVPSGGGGAPPRLRRGGGSLPLLASWGGERGGVRRGRPPTPPPRRASACHPWSPACPAGVYSCRGGCRAAAGVRRSPVSRQRVSAAGGGGGGGGETPPPWFAAPPSSGRPLEGLLCLRRPGRRWSAVGRQRAGRAGACLGRGAPSPRVQRPLWGACGAAVSSVCLRPLLGLRGGRGGSGGGPLVPWRRPLTAEGGRHGGPGPWGQQSAGGSHPSPTPLYLESDSRAGPRWGPSSPPPSSRGAGRPGAAVRVSGQRLVGCGVLGSPPCSLSLPSPPREVASAPSSRRIVGGAWVGGLSSPPHFLASAVWAVTCAAACLGAGAVAAAGCAGGSASGRGCCASRGGASCWRPHL